MVEVPRREATEVQARETEKITCFFYFPITSHLVQNTERNSEIGENLYFFKGTKEA